MKKRLSSPLTVIIALSSAILFWAACIWLGEKFSFPDWVNTLFLFLGFILYFEITGRFGPKPFETSLSWFASCATKDKAVILISFGLYYVLLEITRAVSDTASWWVKLLLVLSGILLPLTLAYVFGSDELRKKIKA